MPVSKTLSKVQKNLAGKDIHPKGRRFKQLNRATLRHEKLTKEKTGRVNQKQGELVRTTFFQEAAKISDNQESFSVDEIKHFIKVFISKEDEELAKEKAARRKGRPKSAKQDQLERKLDAQKSEFKSGFLLPDMTDKENVKNLKKWEGTAGGMTNIRYIRVSETTTEDTVVVDEDVAM